MRRPSLKEWAAHCAGRVLARRHDAFTRYGVAVLLSIGVSVLSRLLGGQLAGVHFVLPLMAVCLASLGGARPGLLAAALSVAGQLPILSYEAPSFLFQAHHHPYRMIAFGTSALLAVVITGALHSVYGSRVRAESLARSQLESLRTITESLGEGILALDNDANLTFMNAAAERMLGWSQRDLEGKPVHSVLHAKRDGSTASAETCPMLAVLHTGLPYREDADSLRRKDGSIFPVSYTSCPIRKDGKVSGLVLTFQDFTAHLRAEEEERFLAEVSAGLAGSIDYEPTLELVARAGVPRFGDFCVVLVRERGEAARRVSYVSPTVDRVEAVHAILSGCNIDMEARTETVVDMRDDRTASIATFPQVGRSARAPGVGAEGKQLTADLVAPLQTKWSEGTMLFGITQARKRNEERDPSLVRCLAERCSLAIDRAYLYRQAQEALDARDEILQIVSHDLRNPLNVILSGTGVLQRKSAPGAPGESVRKMCSMIERAGHRMSALIADLTDLAALDAGALSVERLPEDPVAIARDVIEGYRAVAEERNVATRLSIEGMSGTVACDRGRIAQVLSNLVQNAIHATPSRGSVTLSVGESAGETLFAVSDTGRGISADELLRLFERRWRGKGSAYAGSGLGLFIARKIVDAHGGRIWAESELGKGSIFRLALPQETGRRVSPRAQ